MNKLFVLLILIGCSSLSCKKETLAPTGTERVQIAAAGIDDGRRILLFADQEQLTVGYNPIYIRIEAASGAVDAQTTIHVTPVMDMHTMQHSSPVEQPVYVPSTGLHAGAVVFTMPSGDMGSWTLAVEADGHRVEFAVPVGAAPAGTRPVQTAVGTDGTSYTIALVQPRKPKTGLNDLEVLINTRATMHDFPPADGLEVVVEPEMPSMGHGSPNNVAPTGIGNGRYRGKVNFTMTGDWRLHFTLKRNGTVILEDAYLDVLF